MIALIEKLQSVSLLSRLFHQFFVIHNGLPVRNHRVLSSVLQEGGAGFFRQVLHRIRQPQLLFNGSQILTAEEILVYPVLFHLPAIIVTKAPVPQN